MTGLNRNQRRKAKRSSKEKDATLIIKKNDLEKTLAEMAKNMNHSNYIKIMNIMRLIFFHDFDDLVECKNDKERVEKLMTLYTEKCDYIKSSHITNEEIAEYLIEEFGEDSLKVPII